jgi:hypothetical protein
MTGQLSTLNAMPACDLGQGLRGFLQFSFSSCQKFYKPWPNSTPCSSVQTSLDCWQVWKQNCQEFSKPQSSSRTRNSFETFLTSAQRILRYCRRESRASRNRSSNRSAPLPTMPEVVQVLYRPHLPLRGP